MVMKTLKLGHHHMLKFALLGLLTLFYEQVVAQNEYPVAKNSHIKLDGGSIRFIRPNVPEGWARGLEFYNQDMSERFIALGTFGHGDNMNRFYIASGASPWNSGMGLYILPNGNIGIGTYSPTRRLEVAGPTKWTGNAASYTEINSTSNGHYIRQYANNGTTESWIIRGYVHNGVQAMFNQGGINVNGTVKAKEVNITNTGWADHVFDPDYPLMDLRDLKRYLKKNRHLPGIPTEVEVAEQGINLGELNVRLLEKIEELTLYVIQQQQESANQMELIKHLKDRIGILEGKQALSDN
jgi:hypothetical protein